MNPNLLSPKFFKSSSAWLILVIGIACYYIGYFQIDPNSIAKEIVIKIGDVFVIGVIIGYLTNVSHLLGIFKSDLENVIYGKEFLSKRNDLNNIWENVSKQMFKSKFPSISRDLLNVIKDSYLPVNEVTYYNDYNILIEISWYPNQKDFVIVKTTTNFDLYTDTKEKFEFPHKKWINVEDLHPTDYYVHILKYTVNNVDYSNCREAYTTNNNIYEFTHIVTLEGSTKYDVSSIFEEKYSFEKDYQISFRAKYITNKLKVQLVYPSDMKATFINRGTTQDFKIINNTKGNINMQYKGLILPKQGYVIALSKI